MQDALNSLKNDIWKRRCRNHQSKDFILSEWLTDILTEERVWAVIVEAPGIPPQDKKKVLETVWDGAWKIFSTLVHLQRPALLCQFIAYDQFQNQDLDRKMPFGVEELEKIFGRDDVERKIKELKEKARRAKNMPTEEDLSSKIKEIKEVAKMFAQDQYFFFVPSFPQSGPHRRLSDEIRLPFVKEIRLGQGSFGEAFKVELPLPVYREGTHKTQALVRKGIKSAEAPEDEIRCLRILGMVNHPNIAKLIGSYTYLQQHSLLFPMANSGDLQTFISQPDRPRGLGSDSAVYRALCGLASGMARLHNFSYEELNLDMIGCHRDLKPRNILVNGSDFILADFGLTTMKDSMEDPRSLYRDRDPVYVAPECENLQTFEKYFIGRESDIWSFGCIIAVLLTYIKLGHEGVEQFKEARKVSIESIYTGDTITLWTFHNGEQGENPGVTAWLSKLEQSGSRAERHLVSLITDMLELEPERRVKIEKVASRLRYVALVSMAESMEQEFSSLPYAGILDFDLQRECFRSWISVLYDFEKTVQGVLRSEAVFDKLIKTMSDLSTELTNLRHADNTYPMFVCLRHLNEELALPFSTSMKESIRRLVELKIIQGRHVNLIRSDNEGKDIKFDKDAGSPAKYTDRVLTLLSIQHMTKLSHESESSGIQMKYTDIIFDKEEVVKGSKDEGKDKKTSKKDMGRREKKEKKKAERVPTFRTGTLQPPAESKSPTGRRIVVEELVYGSNWHDQTGEELFKRMENVVSFPDTTPDFRALRSVGYYHNPQSHLFGLVYSYPNLHRGEEGQTPQVLQLAEMLHESAFDYTHNKIIGLGDRFCIALSLAKSILEFHKVGWLHKNVSSHNVLFFLDPKEYDPSDRSEMPIKRNLTDPYLIGFSHSRQAGDLQYSNKMELTEKAIMHYSHPDYNPAPGSSTRYRSEYDYYSLGLILLEIGYWKPLTELERRLEEKTRSEIREGLMKSLVPFLVGTMGDSYFEAVHACLSGVLVANEYVDENFERLVVRRLEKCVHG